MMFLKLLSASLESYLDNIKEKIVDIPNKLEITQIKENGVHEILGTLEWNGEEWKIVSDIDLYYIVSMIKYGLQYGKNKFSFNDRELYIPLVKSRNNYLHFIPV